MGAHRNRDERNIVTDEKTIQPDDERARGAESPEAAVGVPVEATAASEPTNNAAAEQHDAPAEHADPDVHVAGNADAVPTADAVPSSDAADRVEAPSATSSHGETPAGSTPPQYGVGPLSIREVALLGVWGLAFILSFFPIYGDFGSGSSVWTAGIDWVLTIGTPTVAVFLLILRRFSPQGIRRVGSLGIDQFASVAFSVSAVIWLGIIWGSFVTYAQRGIFIASWVVWVELVLFLAGVVLTVVAPHLPVLAEDFRHRADAPAHRIARATRPLTPRPAPVRTASAAADAPHAAGERSESAAATTVLSYGDETSAGGSASGHTTPSAAGPAAEPGHQAFWALAPAQREVVDETGAPLFEIGPSAWALVIEDRGEVFVVRHEDGRVGYLHDTSDVLRG